MQHSPSLDHSRIARAAIMNGVSVPPVTAAVLESRGININELTERVQQNLGHRV